MSAPDSFQVAVFRACTAFGDDAWNRLGSAERSFAIRQELRRLDAEEAASRQQTASVVCGMASDTRVRLRSGLRDRSGNGRSAGSRPALEASALPVTVARGSKTYRVVVRSKQYGRKSFRWEIVDDNTDVTIRQATAWYSTMEEAYDCGAVEMAKFCAGKAGSRQR